MKKYILVLAVMFLAISCNKASDTNSNGANNSSSNTSANAAQPSNQNTPSSDTKTNTYKNSTYNFQIDYPESFTVSDPTYANLEQKVVQFQLARTEYPGTNFDDAAVTVSLQPATSLQDCLSANLPENPTGFQDTKAIGGLTFYVGQGGGAGAGNLYTSHIFRSYTSGTCYELLETVHTSNIGNFDPGTVKEVDPNPIWNRLDAVVSTFKLD